MRTASTTPLRLDSVDEYLGPAATRFFGVGYRRVRYTMPCVAVRDGRLNTTVGVEYPVDWSRKSANVDLRPHLSTVDALVLTARSAELYLNHALGMDLARRRTAWLRRVDIKAGAQPYEDGLDALEIEAVHRDTATEPGSRCGYRSTFDGRVGNMTVRCEIEHERPESPVEVSLPELTASAPRRLYGDGYQHQGQALRDVRIDVADLRADATVTIDPALPADPSGDGLEAYYQPSLSMVDSFVISLQLGQVLLYELDQLPRSRSNTLWMRHTTISSDTPERPVSGPVEVTTSLVDSRLLESRGATWRTATIVGQSPGVVTRCAVVHKVPTA